MVSGRFFSCRLAVWEPEERRHDARPRLIDGRSGATIVNIHSGQPDPKKVIDSYASSVLAQIGNMLSVAKLEAPTV